MGKSTASPEYQPRYKWRLTWPGEVEGDFAGYDGADVIGRIFQTHHHPVDGLWKWNGGLPERFKGKPPMPNSAFETTAREASRKIEEYWEMAKEKAR